MNMEDVETNKTFVEVPVGGVTQADAMPDSMSSNYAVQSGTDAPNPGETEVVPGMNALCNNEDGSSYAIDVQGTEDKNGDLGVPANVDNTTQALVEPLEIQDTKLGEGLGGHADTTQKSMETSTTVGMETRVPQPVAGPPPQNDPDPTALPNPGVGTTSSDGYIQGQSDSSRNAQTTKASSSDVDANQSLYQVKWISWQGQLTPIITQNENGPCPLIAIFNVLLLFRKIELDKTTEIISSSQILTHIANVIWDHIPSKLPDDQRLNFEQTVSDAMSILPQLQTGLDVNVKFCGVTSFEYTQELTIFDLLGIPLFHGWLIDPQDARTNDVIGKLSYNQLVEKIINEKSGSNQDLIEEALIAEEFLESTASQITHHGIVCLCEEMEPGNLAVLFRNNHFLTVHRHNNELFTLVTDLGFLSETNVIWETLSSVQGDSHFVDGTFLNSPPKSENVGEGGGIATTDFDYELALSLQNEDPPTQPGPSHGYNSVNPAEDYALAVKLQKQEEQAAQKRQQVSPHHPKKSRARSAHPGGSTLQADSSPQRPASAPHDQQGSSHKQCSIL